MSRRKSNAEVLILLFTRLPAWLAFVFALTSFIVLRWVAHREAEPPVNTAELGFAITQQLVNTFAKIAQFAVPVLFVLGGCGSLLKRRRASRLLDQFGEHSLGTDSLSWRDFERLVCEIFRRQGYRAVETPAGPDGGVDIVLTRGTEKLLVQCKHWKARRVGVKVVRELAGVITAYGASGGAIATLGRFTPDAVEFAKRVGIVLVDEEGLRKVAGIVSLESEPPKCPKCGSKMVKRVARKGRHRGSEFWGCNDFPRCRGILEIADAQAIDAP